MDSNLILAGGAALVPLVQFLKWAKMPSSWAPASLGVLSLVVTALLIYQSGGVVQEKALSYFSGWVTIMLTASGGYGFASVAFPEQTPVAKVGQPKPKAP